MRYHLRICNHVPKVSTEEYIQVETINNLSKNKEFLFLCNLLTTKKLRPCKISNVSKKNSATLKEYRGYKNLLPLAISNNTLAKYKPELHRAILELNHEKLEDLLTNGFPVDITDSDNWTALHVAVCRNDVVAVDLLLAHGANPAFKSKTSRSPLYFAILYGLLEMTTKLVEKGGDVNEIVTEYDTDFCNYIHLAVEVNNYQIVKYLIENNADLNVRNCCGETPLHLAYRLEIKDIVYLLLKGGARGDQEDAFGHTVLYMAAQNNNSFIIKLLLRQPNLDINKTDKNMVTALHVATKLGNDYIVSLLCQANADVNVPALDGQTSLHIACCRRAEKSLTDILNNWLGVPENGISNKIMDTLLTHGANVNANDHLGLTPLHISTRDQQLKQLEKLLDFEADVNVEDHFGITPVEFCLDDTSDECLIALINYGANIEKLLEKNEFWSLELESLRRKVFLYFFSRQKAELNVEKKLIENLSKHEIWKEVKDNFEDKCTQELDKMRNKWTHMGLSAYDLLHSSRMQLMKIGLDTNVQDFLLKLNQIIANRTELPIYCGILKKNLTLCLKVKSVIERAMKKINSKFNDALPNEFLIELMSYLKVHDINNINIAL